MESDPSSVHMLDEPQMLAALKGAPWLKLPVVGSWLLANDLLVGPPVWAEKVGVLSSQDRRDILTYLMPRAGLGSFFPSTLLLALEPGRYSIATWDSKTRQAVGIEIATASPLVCGPPCNGFPLFLVIRCVHED